MNRESKRYCAIIGTDTYDCDTEKCPHCPEDAPAMKVRTDFHSVNLATGEKTNSIVGDGQVVHETVPMKRDQLDTQRHGKEVDGDRYRNLAKHWREVEDELSDTQHRIQVDVKWIRAAAEGKLLHLCADQLDATAATPTEPPKERSDGSVAFNALWNFQRETLFGQLGKLPTNEQVNKAVRWWLTNGCELREYDRPDADLLAATAPNGKRDLDGLRAVESAVNALHQCIHKSGAMYQIMECIERIDAALAAQRDNKENK